MDSIRSVFIKVEIQENGIIRNKSGHLIGRLRDDVEYSGEHISGLQEPLPTVNPFTKLTELRERATQGKWQQYPNGTNLHMGDRCGIASQDGWEWAKAPKKYVAISDGEYGAMDLDDAAYICTFHNSFHELKRMDDEKTRKIEAAEKLVEAVRGMDLRGISSHWEQRDAALRSYDEAMKEGV